MDAERGKKMKNKRMKKSLSIVLMLVLLMSLFGGVAHGPEAMAITKSQMKELRIGLKSLSYQFDNAAESYNDIDNTNIYQDEPVCLVFKKTGGKCRIPKGSYVKVFYENDYTEFTEDGLNAVNAEGNGYKARYSSRALAKDTNQCSWYWNKPWKIGNYRVCLFVPYTSDYGSGKYICVFSWKRKIYRYG